MMAKKGTTSYGMGRRLARVASAFGWLVAATGVALAGYAVVAVLERGLEAGTTSLALGLLLALAGLVAVAASHQMRAAFDTADMLRALLADPARVEGPARPAASTDGPPPPVPPVPPDPGPRLRPVRSSSDGRPHPVFSAKPPR